MQGDVRADRERRPGGLRRGSTWWRASVFAYLSRFPLIAAAALVLVPYLSGEGRVLDSLVGGAFELSWKATIYVMLGGFTLAWTVLVTVRLIWMYGRLRFVELNAAGEEAAGQPGFLRRWWLAAMDCERWTGHWLAALLVLPLLHRVIVTNTASREVKGFFWWSEVAGRLEWTVIGGLISLSLLWLAEILHRRWRPPTESDKAAARFLLLPPQRRGLLARAEAQADKNVRRKMLRPNRGLGKIYARLVGHLGPGYRADSDPSKLYAGHALAASLLLASFVVYLGFGIPQAYFQNADSAPSSLGYLLSTGVLLTWGLTGLSFFFDRLRVPVALPILAWFYLMTYFPSNEHHFAVFPRAHGVPQTPTAAEVVGARESIIVVAAAGGGIRASAWTARVLVGLDELCRKDPEMRRRRIRFSPNVRLLSGVSGGSLAILNFASEYQPDHGGWIRDPVAVMALSEHSSLDPLVWGLVYPDFGRALLPFLISPTRNRGGELENEWSVRLKKIDRNPEAGLATWRQPTLAGDVPALIFNSTNAETGERIITGTTRMGKNAQRGRVMFDELYRSIWDLAPVTAARMSATFPYITPAAKPDFEPTSRGNTSWVDGGYSDNFGMASVLDWVEEALAAPDSKLRRVMVIQIQAAPDPLAQASAAQGGRGIYYQLGIPLEAMLSVWNSGQAVRNDTQLAMIQVAWQYHESEKKYLIDTVYCALRLAPDATGATPTLPLSWHLTDQQKRQLDVAWSNLAQDKDGPWPKVRSFLLGEMPK